MAPEGEPKSDWARHSYRVLNLIDNQVRSLRKRQAIESFKSGARKGAYWGIRTDIKDYGLTNALDCPLEQTTQLAETPTRLKRLDDGLQERLINWVTRYATRLYAAMWIQACRPNRFSVSFREGVGHGN